MTPHHDHDHALYAAAERSGLLRIPDVFRIFVPNEVDGMCERGHWWADCRCWDEVEEDREQAVAPEPAVPEEHAPPSRYRLYGGFLGSGH